jgi:ADP-dependent NAD(P)H-hydrate dehydratase / NAD(P)H-hydrate epimerase
MKVVSVEAIREIEAAVDASIITYEQMMLNAGNATGTYLLNRLDITSQTHIILLIGKGNNGGDGLVIAHHLAQHSQAQIQLYMLEQRSTDDSNYKAVIEDQLFITLADDDDDSHILKNMISNADIIIDAIFGIGVRLPLYDTTTRILSTINQLITPIFASYGDVTTIDPTLPNQLPKKNKPFILAIDCPSGINCNTGEADPNTIPADETITFIAAKYGMFTFPAAKYIGKLVLSQIGIPDSQTDLHEQPHFIIDNHTVKNRLPHRPVDGHKGTFGKVFIVAGSRNYIGATALSGESAYRSGAGLVTIATTTPIIQIIASQLREPTFIHLPDKEGAIAETATNTVIESSNGYTSLLIGCGLGQHDTTKAFVKNLLTHHNLPSLIIDADALNILSQMDNWWGLLPQNTIITPHVGEMARLTNLSTSDINANRWQIASQKAKEWNLIVVLKGAHTLVASPDGEVGVIPFKTDALGTAGTGDVLAGLIAGLHAQGTSAFDSAVVGTYIHALAGIIAIQQVGNSRSVIARDVLNAIGVAFAQVESDSFKR